MDLTFAEQVKIVLGRKNMTIKQLAEEIQEKTGNRMSRQNLTQRLGRDNFQEQDMRMIAEILGCPFQLNILDAVEEEDGERLFEIRRKAEAKAQKKEAKEEKKEEEASGNDVTVGDMIDMLESVEEAVIETAAAEEEKAEEVSEAESAILQSTAESDTAGPMTESDTVGPMAESDAASPMAEPDADKSTDGLHASELTMESGPARPITESESAMAKDESRSAAAAAEPAQVREEPEKEKQIPKWEPKPAEKKVDRSSIWNRREEKLRRKKETHPHGDWIGATPQSRSKDFMKDAAEFGEINPYTGKEYETNSVRMHPKRIGYIQVYDRGNHKWTDMTEWAFYGFQEQKKSLLGSDYDEPIYLD